MSSTPKIRVGIGGWVYPPWRGTFYPSGLPQARELSHASRQVTAIEINGTFYGRQKPESFRRWHEDTPEDFLFSVKGPRYATHRADLAAAGPSIDRFFGSGVLELRDKLGPILWQFAPWTRFEEAGFASPSFADLLRRHRGTVAMVDDDNYPVLDEVTGDFVYARLRRCAEAELTGYPADALDDWAARFREHGAQRDCFVYFINGAKVRAPAAAQALLQRLAS